MKFMGWTYPELLAAPEELVTEAIDLLIEASGGESASDLPSDFVEDED